MHNAKFIVKNHFGVRARNKWQLKKHLYTLVNYPFLIKEMHNNLKKDDETDIWV